MRFHRRLVELAFPAGGIQLLRFRTPDAIIGVLYNFVYRGKVYFYQSGFAYAADKKLRPGIVSIGQAVQHCLQDVRLSEFHMMADGGHYKEHMSSHSHPVEWLLVRKRNIRNRTVDALRTVKWKIAPPKGRATPVASEGTNDSGA
jgi:CelD/BcsL family acetyltransferase involved in cellulose biosynthesis